MDVGRDNHAVLAGKLLAWVGCLGGSLHPNATIRYDGTSGYGIYAAGDIPCTEPLISVPIAAIICPQSAMMDVDIQGAVEYLSALSSPPLSSPLPSALPILLKLAKERYLWEAANLTTTAAAASASKDILTTVTTPVGGGEYGPYIAMLPRDSSALVHCKLDSETIDEFSTLLQNTPLLMDDVLELREHLHKCMKWICDTINAEWLHHEYLLWSFAMYTSRAMRVPLPLSAFGKNVYYPAMVPLADLCNHSSRSASRFEFKKAAGQKMGRIPNDRAIHHNATSHTQLFDALPTSSTVKPRLASDCSASMSMPTAISFGTVCPGLVTVISGRTLHEGDEAVIPYGSSSNEELVLYYGFVDPLLDSVRLRASPGTCSAQPFKRYHSGLPARGTSSDGSLAPEAESYLVVSPKMELEDTLSQLSADFDLEGVITRLRSWCDVTERAMHGAHSPTVIHQYIEHLRDVARRVIPQLEVLLEYVRKQAPESLFG